MDTKSVDQETFIAAVHEKVSGPIFSIRFFKIKIDDNTGTAHKFDL
jgi:hypothetical protein